MFGLDHDMIFRIPALLVALTIHEYAHARVAVWLGDDTPRALGRLTLNPVPHLDPFGLIMLWLFKFGWAKPVPINPNNFRNVRQGMILVSLAGPVANMLIALLVALGFGILAKNGFLNGEWVKVLLLTYNYNIVFAIFNLLPLPPLDGSKVLMSLLPWRQAEQLERFEPYAPFVLMALVYIGVFSYIIEPLAQGLSQLINFIVMLVL